MAIYKFTSVKLVINKIVRDLGLYNEEIPYQDFIEWIAEALRHIGAYPQYVDRETMLEVENHRAELPCDFYKLIRLYSDDRNRMAYKNEMLMDGANIEENRVGTKNYSINQNTITWSEPEATIKLQYLAIPVDEEMYPLVPDSQSFFDALFWKVVYQMNIRGYQFPARALNDTEYVRRKWNFYCKQSRADANSPDLESLERIKNNWLSLKPRVRDYANNFRNSGLPQNYLNGKHH